MSTHTTASDYGIDSHKLIYHVERVSQWLRGETIYPVYIEAAPAGGCNQRCIFCGLDYLDHKPYFLGLNAWKRFVSEAAEKGVKSILLSGEGEPLLNKETPLFIAETKTKGIDVALASNATLLTPQISRKILKDLSWLRISLDAATPRTYATIHGVNPGQFNQVLQNIAYATHLKRKHHYSLAIGIQFLLLRQNMHELKKATLLAPKLGVDYFSIKPYSKHPLSINEAGARSIMRNYSSYKLR